jgi:pimeloyl-ACP methyl ester carboxylesterase
LNVDTVKVREDERQLAANFTASKQLALSRSDRCPVFRWLGLLLSGAHPGRTASSTRMDVYDPQRIPVVFVHGLLSDPHIWLNAVNAINSDPELRAAYQPWYFLYPTGHRRAADLRPKLRESLRQARDFLIPTTTIPA